MKLEKSKNPKSVTEIDQNIGSFLKDKRKKNGLSQTEVAKMIGITFQQLQKYESGLNRVTVAKLFDLGRALNFNISSFFNNISDSIHFGVTKFSDKSQEADNFFNISKKNSTEINELIEKWNKIKRKKDKEIVLILIDSLLK